MKSIQQNLLLFLISSFFLAGMPTAQAFVPPATTTTTKAAPQKNIFFGARVTTDSGLSYEDLVVGEGARPGARDFVSVHYVGKQNGRVFDTSRPANDIRAEIFRGDPLEFPLGRNRVIAGWEEGVATMRVGGTRRLYIPSKLAYGAAGTPDGVVKPNADLEFDVELVSISGSMDTAGGLAKGFAFAIGMIFLNGFVQVLTGHELREYINGSMS